jgi:cell wall-associated NlpC family hydrolase
VAVLGWRGRTPAATGLLAVALLVPQTGAVAEPRPTVAQVKAKLVKLNEQADDVVEKYNQATESYKKAKKNYKDLSSRLKKKSARVDTLRKDLVSVAVNAYQVGGATEWPGLFVQADPGAVLSQLASVNQMALEQSAALHEFEATTKELRADRDQAKTILGEADNARDKISAERKKISKLIMEQTKLLRRLNAYKSGNTNSTGARYTGSASGSARSALQFAYAQIGKPYRYGGTGPGSYDCSGFAQASWRAGGVSLPRTTYSQWAWGANRRVSLDALQPGDLLFSKGLGHMGIYVGNGQMVHAPQTGDVIKIVTLDGYWKGRLLGAVRP